jgi:hypothetical protein
MSDEAAQQGVEADEAEHNGASQLNSSVLRTVSMQSPAEWLDEVEVGVLKALSVRQVRYLIIGSVAKRVHGLDRPHRDLDLVVDRSIENATRLLDALTEDLRQAGPQLSVDVLCQPDQRISVRYLGLDLLTSAGDLQFDELFRGRCLVDVGELKVGVVCREHLCSIMRTSGRTQDLDDLAAMGGE